MATVSTEVGALVQAFRDVLSANNQTRGRAENDLQASSTADPNKFFATVMTIASEQTDPDLRRIAIVYMKTFLRSFLHTESSNTVWGQLLPENRLRLRQVISTLLTQDQNKNVRRTAGQMFADLAIKLHSIDEWPRPHADLIAWVAEHPGQNHVEVIEVISDLVMTGDESFLDATAEYAQLIAGAIKSPTIQMRIAALQLVSCCVIALKDSRDLWQPMVPFCSEIIHMLSMLCARKALSPEGEWVPTSSDNEDLTLEVVSHIIELAEGHSAFFKPCITSMLETCFAVTRNVQCDTEIRSYVFELVLTILQDKPKMCLAVPKFRDTMLDTCIEVMLTVQEDEAKDDGEAALFATGERGLDYLVKAVGADMFPKLFSYIKELINGVSWQQRYTGVICICQTTEYIPAADQIKTLQDMVPVALKAIRDPHEIVRLAAVRCIGQMAYDSAPTIQVYFCNDIMEALIERLADTEPAVVSKALRAYTNMTDELTGADLQPYMERCLAAFVRCLQVEVNTQEPELVAMLDQVREHAVIAISVTASIAGKRFIPFYKQAAPLVVQIIEQPVRRKVQGSSRVIPGNEAIRAAAVDCITYIGQAVGPEIFAQDGVEVMRKLIELKTAVTDADDPVVDNIYDAWRRMVRALGPQNFKQFVPQLVAITTTVLQSINSAEKIENMTAADEDYTFWRAGQGYKAVKSSIIYEMNAALLVVEVMAETEGLIDEVAQQLAETIIALLKHGGAFTIFSQVLRTLQELIERMTAAGNSAPLPEMLNHIIHDSFGVVDTLIKEEPELEESGVVLSEITQNLARVLKAAAPGHISREAMIFTMDSSFSILGAITNARGLVWQRMQDHNLDDEDRSKVNEEFSTLGVTNHAVVALLGGLMNNNGLLFIEIAGQRCCDYMSTQCLSESPADVAVGLSVACDLLQYLGDYAVTIWEIFLEKMIVSCNNAHPDLRQAAAYGIVHASKRAEFTKEMTSTAINSLAQGIQLGLQHGEDEDHRMATDNIVAALHSIIVCKGALIDDSTLAELTKLCYSHFPLTSDVVESLALTKDVVERIKSNNPHVLGQNNSNLPLLIAGLAKCYRTIKSSEENDEAIVDALRSLGEENFKTQVSAMPEDSQKYVERLWKDVFTV